jgi:hypothetical protein
VNTSIMVVHQSLLGPALRLIGRQNSQQEYYLTDLVGVLHDMGHLTTSWQLDDASEALGVNDRGQLAQAERVLRARINDQWMSRGVTMWDPSQTYVDADVEMSPEVTLLPGTILKGHCGAPRRAARRGGRRKRDHRHDRCGPRAYWGRRERCLLRRPQSRHRRFSGRDCHASLASLPLSLSFACTLAPWNPSPSGAS